jgi:hypothetical protein
MKYYNLGKSLDDQMFLASVIDRDRVKMPAELRPFQLSDEELNTGTLVVGTTGSGKSRCLWQLLREHRRNRRGFCLIDPGDLVEDFLADCAREIINTGNRDLLKKIHLVELSPLQLARHDPFRFSYPKPIHPELRETVYRSWQHTKVQSFAEIYQWKQAQSTDFEGMPRLQRNFINVFTAVSTLVNEKRLSIGDAQILVDLGDAQHYPVYARLKHHLPREIVSDFEVLHGFRSVRDLRTETESFLNRLRSMHGPLLKQTLSGTGKDPVIDLFRIIQRGEFLLVKTGKTLFASSDQNLGLAGIFIHDVIEAMLVTPRELRKSFTLVIDEAHKYVRPGIGDIARTARKYQLGLVLATTDLASLKKEDLDLAPELLSVVNTVVAFRMTWPEDLKKMAEFLYAQNIEFKELVHEVERRAGPQWFQVDDWSETTNRQRSKSATRSVSATFAETAQETRSRSTTQNQSTSSAPNGRPGSTTAAIGTADTRGSSTGTSYSSGTQDGVTEGETEGFGVTINHKLVHIEKTVRELQKTGKLDKAVADQIARFAQKLSGQSRRRATVRVRERAAIEIEAVEVRDPFLSAAAQAKAVEWIKRELFQTHDYYFTPSLDPAEDERRIREFLADEPAAPMIDDESNRATRSLNKNGVSTNGQHGDHAPSKSCTLIPPLRGQDRNGNGSNTDAVPPIAELKKETNPLA